MNVESFGAVREHSRGRPLPRPKFDFSKNALPFARQFAKTSAMPLRVNFPPKNFHARDPDFLHFRFATARRKLAGINARFGDALGQRTAFVIARRKCFS